MKNHNHKLIDHHKELKKHVSTIHCANSLSLLQRKIANALLFHAYDDLLLHDDYHITIKELCSLIGYDSHDYKTIKKALIDLLSTVIEWNIIEEGLPESEGEWNASSIIADASIKGSICSYSYSKRMKQLLYMPSIYGRLNMQIQAQFKSSYGLALYENVVRYQNLTQTPWFELTLFRKLMGVALDIYPIFRDFKRRVIDKAVAEVNAIANLSVAAEFKRVDRQVNSLRFLITKNTLPLKHFQDDKLASSDLTVRLNKDYGLNKKQIQHIHEQYDENYILEKLSIIESSSSYHHGKIINLGKYLLHALQDDYQQPQSSLQKKQKKGVAIEQELFEKKQEQIKELAEQKRYQSYIDAYLKTQLELLPENERDNLLESFALHIQNLEIINKLYQKEGLKNKIIFMEFKNFMKQKFPQLLTNILSFEEFIKNK